MLAEAAAAIFLCLLLPQVNGLRTAEATCRSGYAWMFSSIGQSPCDIAVELGSVCFGSTYQLYPLRPGYVYFGPYAGYDTSCSCSSVFYSMLSACGYCQGEDFLRWSYYNNNCTTVHLGVYTQQIPVGVKVPAYAYQDVSIADRFDVNLAYTNRGIESTRPVPSSTQPSTPTSSSSFSGASSSGGGGGTATAALNANPRTHSPAIIGGVVVGGLVGLGLIAALIIFLVLRSKQKSRSRDYNSESGFQESPDMGYKANDQSTYVSDTNNPYGQNSSTLNTNFTGNSTQNHAPPQTIPQHTGGRYSGMPEL